MIEKIKIFEDYVKDFDPETDENSIPKIEDSEILDPTTIVCLKQVGYGTSAEHPVTE